jgi:hypothetical protein
MDSKLAEQPGGVSAELLVGPGEYGPHVGGILTTVEDSKITACLA